MDVVQRWNDTDRGSSKYSEKNLFLCSFVHHTCHVAWRGQAKEFVERNVWTWE